MSIKNLLNAFSGKEDLPINVNEIVDWVKQQGFQDEVEFVGVELDVGVIRGFLHRFTYHKTPYGNPVCCANIYYDKAQEPEWINIVCAKEVMHLAEPKHFVSSKADLDNLIKRLAMPRSIKVLLEDPQYALSDKFGDAFAAAILLPMASRELLLAPYNDGAIDALDIARLAQIPTQYARMVMDENWPAIYNRLADVFEKS